VLLAQVNNLTLLTIRRKLEAKFTARRLRWSEVKTGIADVLAELNTIKPEGMEDTPSVPSGTEDGKVIVWYDKHIDVFGGRIVEVLKDNPFYSFGGVLAEIQPTHHNHYEIHTHNATTLKAAFHDFIRFKSQITNEQTGKTKIVDYTPERDDIYQYVLHRTTRYLPVLDGIVDIPILKMTGEVIIDPHTYDEDTKLFYAPSVPLFEKEDTKEQLLRMISQDQAKRYIESVWRFFREFPFEDDASKANYLGLLLSLILRPTIPGHCPLFLIDASTRGIGKGLLAWAVGQIRLGRTAGSTPLPREDEEMRKKIGSILAEGQPLVHFDEVQTKIYHSSLAQVLTEDVWRDRVLGSSSMMAYPNKAVWFASGNNIQIGGDFDRRSVLIRLVSDEERPEKRTGFEIPDFPTAIAKMRESILLRLYLITLSWLRIPEEDRPYGQQNLGATFTNWSGIIGGILRYVGIDGFLENQDKIYAKDETTLDWASFLAFWWKINQNQRKKMKDIHAQLFGGSSYNAEAKLSIAGGRTPGFLDTLPEFVLTELGSIRREAEQKKCLARHLLKIEDRNFGGCILRKKTYDNSNESADWWIEKKNEPQQGQTGTK